MNHLQRVLEHVLPVARPEVQAAEELDDLVVELTAVRLEHGLLAGMADVIVDFGLGEVVHLLDPRRVDAAVLDELQEGHLGDLAADGVERGEHDGLGRVVDDHVDAGQVLQRPDVPPFAADDPALHVVRGQLDERGRRLGRVARRHALKRIGDEVSGSALRFRLGFFLELADPAGEVVLDELLGALEQRRLRLVDGHAGDPLQLGELLVLRSLQVLLQLSDVRLAVAQPLLATVQLLQPRSRPRPPGPVHALRSS